MHGRLAHLVEYRFDVARVIGSIPIATTIEKYADNINLHTFFVALLQQSPKFLDEYSDCDVIVTLLSHA